MSNKVKIVIGIGLLSIIIWMVYALVASTKTNYYVSEMQSQRVIKDVWFSNDFESPFVRTNTPFQRLNYFHPNQEFTITANLTRTTIPDSISLITNLGEAQSYLIYGTATFSVGGTNCSLQLLFLDADEDLFIPFIDSTSGNSTYGAGRYLEAAIPHGDNIILDFNLAYNPYCAYVDGFSCPFPPKSNILKIAIEAGEKTFHK